jgi:hypothetical protein
MKYREYVKPGKEKEYIKTVSVALDGNGGGEAVILEVDFFHNGDKENAVFTNISISNHCYGSHVSKISYFSLGIESFLEAFQHMAEIAKTIEKK